MTPPFHEILKQIKPAVVGIGLLAEPADPFSLVVQGTGFVIDPSGWVMTNKHVAELLIQERGGRVGVRNSIARAVFFLEREEPKVIEGHRIDREYGAVTCPIGEVAAPPVGRHLLEASCARGGLVAELARRLDVLPPLGGEG